MQNKSLYFVLLVTFLTLTLVSGCGSKGDLYQTPAPDAVESEQVDLINDATTAETSSKKSQ